MRFLDVRKAHWNAVCKKEEYIFQAVLDWEEECRELKRITGEDVLTDDGMKNHCIERNVLWSHL